MTNLMTRRDFLKAGSAALALSLLPGRSAFADRVAAPPASLGRITGGWQHPIRTEANLAGEIVGYKVYDDIISLYGQVDGEAPWPSNPIWYETDGGYIHSAFVQPVENLPSRSPVTVIAPPGIWLQVCVPAIGTRWRIDSQTVSRQLYYGTVYRAIAALQDAKGEWWYRLQEGIAYSPGPYVPAWSMRHVSPENASALSAGVADKRIEINIKDQVLTCFEDTTPVFSTRTATGLPGTRTPPGQYTIIRKSYTSYMIGGTGTGYYNLPGVAFPSYFTASGIAVHGTYWHNDYGRPKSHGCVNVANDAAQFVFRWTEPNLPYETASVSVKRGVGTLVVVI